MVHRFLQRVDASALAMLSQDAEESAPSAEQEEEEATEIVIAFPGLSGCFLPQRVIAVIATNLVSTPPCSS